MGHRARGDGPGGVGHSSIAVRAAGALPWAEVVRAGIEVSGALDTAHEAGTLHRDLKPDNLRVGTFSCALCFEGGATIFTVRAPPGGRFRVTAASSIAD